MHHVHQRTIRTQSRVSLSGSTRKRPLSADYSGSFPTSLKSVISRSSLVSGSNRSDLLGARKRPSPDDSHSFAVPSSSSRFTIATPAQARGASSHSIAPNSSQASRQTSHKSKSTERSYDPYRASSADTSIPVADHSKITIIENSSMGSRNGYAAYTASLRHPAVQRLHSDQYSTAESIPSDAREFAGNRRSLRRSKLRRESSSSSWASTGLSSSSFRQFPVSSLRHKRIVQITNPRNRSPPPPRPRNPTPGTIRDKYLQDDSSSSGSLTCPASDLNVKKRSPFVDGDETNTKAFTMVPPNNVDRSSILWEERTRQASLELSTLMDEVFFESKIESALWSVKTEEEKHEEFVRRSFDLPGLRGTGYHRPLPNLPLIKAETPQPSSDHTKMRSLYDADSVEELTRVKILLETRARDLDTSSLDPVIGHLNRLLQETPNSRRVWSAPEQSRDRDMASSLSPVREDDEPRLVSNPVKGINGKIEKSTFDGNRSTVRLVHNEDTALFPAPLKIKKKSSMPFLSSTDQYVENEEPQEKKTPQGRLKFGTSTSALDRIFKRDANKSGMLVGSDKTPSKGSPLRRSNGTPLSKGLTDDTEGKNWFRRSQASSHDSGSAKKSETSESRGSNYHPKGNTTNAPEDEFSFRLPKAETIASRCLRFFKGKPKEKRMQIAMPGMSH